MPFGILFEFVFLSTMLGHACFEQYLTTQAIAAIVELFIVLLLVVLRITNSWLNGW